MSLQSWGLAFTIFIFSWDLIQAQTPVEELERSFGTQSLDFSSTLPPAGGAEAGKFQAASSLPGVSPQGNRMEELLIWKLSDELKLTPDEEKKFSELVRDLNHRKVQKGLRIEELTKKFVDSKTAAERDKELKNLRKAHQEYGLLSVQELDEVKSLLGAQRLATYLEVKQDLLAKVKNLIMGDKVGEGRKPLPPPKLIEEKK